VDCALDPELEAAALCAYIEAQVLEYETLQEQLDSLAQAQNEAIEAGRRPYPKRRLRCRQMNSPGTFLVLRGVTSSQRSNCPGRFKRRPSNPSTRLRILSSTAQSIGLRMSAGLIFIVDSAEFSGSSGVALTAAAAVAHFCALQGFGSPCDFPRFGKLLRGIRLTHGKAAKAKEPFTPEHIVTFMDLAQKGTLRVEGGAPPGAVFSAVVTRG
jgi:hypothetical protein